MTLKKARLVYVATVQIAVEVDSVGEACDYISGIFNGLEGPEAMDWGYLRVGLQYLYPSEHVAVEDWNIDSL